MESVISRYSIEEIKTFSGEIERSCQKNLNPWIQMPWIESPFVEKILNDTNIPSDFKQELMRYHDLGYYRMPIDTPKIQDYIKEIIQKLDQFEEREKCYTNMWEHIPAVKSIALDEKVMAFLELLYQRKCIPYQTLNFKKGTEQAAHSDQIHFSSDPSRFMCGVWIALEKMDENNGPLFYFPRSHKLPFWDIHDIGIRSTHNSYVERSEVYAEFIEEMIRHNRLEKEENHAEPGDLLIWSSNLLHGGQAIQDLSRTRYSQVTHYFFEGCQYFAPFQSTIHSKAIAFQEFKNIKTGELVQSPKTSYPPPPPLAKRIYRKLFSSK